MHASAEKSHPSERGKAQVRAHRAVHVLDVACYFELQSGRKENDIMIFLLGKGIPDCIAPVRRDTIIHEAR